MSAVQTAQPWKLGKRSAHRHTGRASASSKEFITAEGREMRHLMKAENNTMATVSPQEKIISSFTGKTAEQKVELVATRMFPTTI